MKVTTFTGLFLAASLTVHAQGKVSFGNDSNHYFVLGMTLSADAALGGGTTNIAYNTVSGAPGAIPASPLPSGITLIAALYAGNGTSGNNLTLATSYALDAAGWLTTGRMVNHGIAVAGLTGGQVDTLAVVVGDRVGALGSPYPTFVDAGAEGYRYYGTSGLFTMTPGTSLSYPSITGGGGSTWAPANLVVNGGYGPEPSTLALAGLGAGLMMFSRRRTRNPTAVKAWLLTLPVTLACCAAFGQGKVSFGNDSNHYFVIGMTLPADVALGGGTADISHNTVSGAPGAIPASPLPSGVTLIAALYAGNGTSGNNLTLRTSYALDAAGWLTTGRMVTHGIAVAGLTGGQVDTLAVVVGDRVGALGSPYPSTFPGYLYIGFSGLFTMTPGTSLSYPSIIGGGSTWAPENLVINHWPEPSTLALVGLGAGLMLFRQRKQ